MWTSAGCVGQLHALARIEALIQLIAACMQKCATGSKSRLAIEADEELRGDAAMMHMACE